MRPRRRSPQWRVDCEVGDSGTLLDLVAHGLGVAVLPPGLDLRDAVLAVGYTTAAPRDAAPAPGD